MWLNRLYTLLLMVLAVLLAPVWLVWMLMVPKIRAGFWEKLGYLPSDGLQKLKQQDVHRRIWLHVVSVGELNAARPLIEQLRASGYALVISTTTATGHQLALNTYSDLPVLYFPFDFPWVTAKMLRIVQPKVSIVLETELWPNFLAAAQHREIPVLLVNGRLSERSFRGYARFRWFFKGVVNRFSRLMMQSRADADRMTRLGADPEKVLAVGNIKFDLAPYAVSEQQDALQQLFAFPAQSPVVVFASSHKGEEEIFLALFQRLQETFPELKAVLAPRHPERCPGVALMLQAQGVRFSLRSQLTPDQPNPAENALVVLDTVGELNAVFGLSTVACMGGSFVAWGGHNPLEPINAHKPVIFGPHMFNFKEIARQVQAAEAGFQVDSPQAAEQRIRELLTRPEYYEQVVRNGQRLMAENRGVTQQVVAQVDAWFAYP